MLKRRLATMIIIFSQLFLIQSAVADDKKNVAKDYKWAYFAGLPAYYFLMEIPIHEGSHGFAVALNSNYELSDFRPYPHFEQGRLLFGSVGMVCEDQNACADKTGLGMIALSPYITTSTLFVTSDILLATNTVEPTSVAGRTLYFAGMVVPWLDFSYNAVWATDMSDAAKIAENFEVPRSSVVATGVIISLVGTWRLWNGYKRAFPKHGKSRSKESNLIIVPIGGDQTVGLTASMQF